TNINSVRSRVNTVTTNVNIVRSRPPVPTRTSNSSSPKRPHGNWGSAVKTSARYNWRNSKPNSNCDSRPTFIRTVNAKGPQSRPKPVKAWVTRINWRILKNSMGGLLPLEVAKATYLWMVHQLTKFHVQRVDMVINPPWNLPFPGAKGLTSPEQTAIGVNIPGSDENSLKLYDLIADMKGC
ncbi:hypothetical protein Tco_1085235, partial [Tanacetum coccineum]